MARALRWTPQATRTSPATRGLADFPTTPGAKQIGNAGGQDLFVSKLSGDGSALTYSTYLGGSSEDIGYGIAVDSSGNAYVTGFTYSADFPTTPGAQQTINAGGGADAFVAKLSTDGSALIYSTFLGGSGYDVSLGIAVDSSGNAYVTGYTTSTDFPTTAGAEQPNNAGSYDAFVAKLSPGGSALIYSTYLGGSSGDLGLGIAVDSSGNACIIGQTQSTDFPTTPGAKQTSNAGSYETFVAKIASASADLAIIKQVSPSPVVYPRGTLTYTLTLHNNGPTAATSLTVSDTLPSTTTFVSCSSASGGTCANNGNAVTITYATLPNGGSDTIRLTATAGSTAPDNTVITNTASVKSSTPDPSLTNNSATASTALRYPADLALQKRANKTSVKSGGTISYAVSVANFGRYAAMKVTITDPLPTGTVFEAVAPSQGACTHTAKGQSGTVICNFGRVANGSGAVANIVVKVTATSGTLLTNTAAVSATSYDPNSTNNASTVNTIVK